MKKFLLDFIQRLLSRKFMITIGGITFFVTVNIPEAAYTPIVALILGYLGAEGAGDALGRFKGSSQFVSGNFLDNLGNDTAASSGGLDDEDVDKSIVEPGQ